MEEKQNKHHASNLKQTQRTWRILMRRGIRQ